MRQIRRWMEHLFNELPPKRRQIIRLKLKALNSRTATSIIQGDYNSTYSSSDAPIIASSEISNDCEEAKEGKGNIHAANSSRCQSHMLILPT